MVRQLQQKGMLPNPKVHKMKMFTFILKYTITNMILTLYMLFLLSSIEFN